MFSFSELIDLGAINELVSLTLSSKAAKARIQQASAWIDLYPNTCCYLHKGSFSHPCGKPMACKSILG